jgi:hypothetical protein
MGKYDALFAKQEPNNCRAEDLVGQSDDVTDFFHFFMETTKMRRFAARFSQ